MPCRQTLFVLRVLEFSNGTLSYPQDNITNNTGGPVFVIEGRKLLTDEGSAQIKYIGRVTDTQLYDASLTEALAARLGAEICYAITGSTSWCKYRQLVRKQDERSTI